MWTAEWLLVAQLAVIAAAGGVFDVRAFGAKGDGASADTDAVRAAAAALREAGGGVLLFPAGRGGAADAVYLTGAFNVSSNTVVRVESGATILGSPHGVDWPLLEAGTVWPQFGHGSDCVPGQVSCKFMHQPLIFGWQIANLSLEGGGVVDCGARHDTWWGCADDLSRPPCSGFSRPHCVMISSATKISLQDLSVRNSPDWTLHFSNVTGLYVGHVNVSNPVPSKNTDGIDIDSSQDVLVEDSHFTVGDDALCVKSGVDYFGRLHARPSRNLVFRRITIGAGHGISVGSETSGGAHNVTFEDITMVAKIGIRIKSQRGRGGIVSDVVYKNILLRSIEEECVQLTMNYHQGLLPTNASATPLLEDVLLENVHCDSGGSSFLIDGLPEQWIRRLRLRNVTMGGLVGGPEACHFAECTCDALTSPCPQCCHAQQSVTTFVL